MFRKKMAENSENNIVEPIEEAPVDIIKLQQEFFEMFGQKSTV